MALMEAESLRMVTRRILNVSFATGTDTIREIAINGKLLNSPVLEPMNTKLIWQWQVKIGKLSEKR